MLSYSDILVLVKLHSHLSDIWASINSSDHLHVYIVHICSTSTLHICLSVFIQCTCFRRCWSPWPRSHQWRIILRRTLLLLIQIQIQTVRRNVHLHGANRPLGESSRANHTGSETSRGEPSRGAQTASGRKVQLPRKPMMATQHDDVSVIHAFIYIGPWLLAIRIEIVTLHLPPLKKKLSSISDLHSATYILANDNRRWSLAHVWQK